MHRVLIPSHISPYAVPLGTVHQMVGETMGTTWSVKLVSENTFSIKTFRSEVQQQLENVVAEMSHWKTDSVLGCFNRAAAGSWHPLPKGFFTVLSYALDVAKETDGAYDPAAGALVNLWGFGPFRRYNESGFSIPAQDAIQALIQTPAWQRMALDRSAAKLLQPGGVVLDLSAIAKGYAVDAVALYLGDQGIGHYLVEIGGELRGAGIKPDGQPWWVSLEQPPNHDSPATKKDDDILVALHGLAIATSGDYRRYFFHEGKRYPHTLDPRTGYPIDTRIASVTVLHPECMAADAWSTALTVMGVEQGLALAQQKGLAARFLVHENGHFVEYASTAFLDMLQ